MSVVIGVIGSGGAVAMAADSAAVSGKPGGPVDEITPAPSKIFLSGSHLIGYSYSFRLGLTVRSLELPEPPEDPKDLEAHIGGAFLDAVVTALDAVRARFGPEPDFLGFESRLGGQLMVGCLGQLFVIQPDGCVLPGSMWAIGAARAYAYGSLHSTQDLDLPPAVRARMALDASLQYSPLVRGPGEVLLQTADGVVKDPAAHPLVTPLSFSARQK
jgi:hypothetical protein